MPKLNMRLTTNVTTNSTGLNWITKVHSRLIEHIQNGTTDLSVSSIVRSTRAEDVYFSPIRDRVAMEVAPILVLPSCLLPKGHIVVAKLPSKQPSSSVLLYRDPTTHQVRAYKNQCRHRGAELFSPILNPVTQPRKLKGSPLVTCPYHSWTYHMDTGQLKGIPGQVDRFPCLENLDHGGKKKKDGLSLHSLPCREQVGGIWVGGDASLKESDFSQKTMDDELRDLWLDPPTVTSNDDNTHGSDSNDSNSDGTDRSRLVGFREWTIEANWQLLVETFLESYHVQHLHKQTLGQVTYGNRMVVDFYKDSRSLRHTVPLRNFDLTFQQKIHKQDDEDDDDVHVDDDDNNTLSTFPISPIHPFFTQTTTTCFVFPNVAISFFKRFVLMVSIHPISNTTSHIQAFGITHQTAALCFPENTIEKQQRDFENVMVGIEEDWECAQGIQRGLTPDTIIHHGRFEGNNQYFLDNVGQVAEKLSKR